MLYFINESSGFIILSKPQSVLRLNLNNVGLGGMSIIRYHKKPPTQIPRVSTVAASAFTPQCLFLQLFNYYSWVKFNPFFQCQFILMKRKIPLIYWLISLGLPNKRQDIGVFGGGKNLHFIILINFFLRKSKNNDWFYNYFGFKILF